MPNTNFALQPSFTLKGELTYFDFRMLNQGGFGITYSANAYYILGRIRQMARFAVKELFPRDLAVRHADGSVGVASGKEHDFQECLDEFRREGKMLHELNHKGIVPVNEVIEANGTIYYVMCYLGDMSLTRYVSEQGGKLSEDEAKRIMDALLDAVGYLHQQRLNHLDIKPDNVMMVESEDGVRTPVLIDFGVSKHFHNNGKQTSRLGGKGVTEGFSPMEQYVGITTFSPKADIYALGATFFYMLTGKTPLKATDMTDGWLRGNITSDITQMTVNSICRVMERDYLHRTADVKDFYIEPEKPLPNQPISITLDIREDKEEGETDESLNPLVELNLEKVNPHINKNLLKYVLAGFLAIAGLIFLFSLLKNDQAIKWNGGLYKGSFENGIPQGEGEFRRNAITYIGQWTNGELTNGKIISPKFVYEGGIEDFKFDGYGVCLYKDGHCYKGYWSQDNKEGLGLLSNPDGKMTFAYYSSGIAQIPEGQQFQHGDVAYGIDVSWRQGNIHWEDLFLSANESGGVNGILDVNPTYIQPVLFVIFKATEGSDITDKKFAENFSDAKRCGILRGAYHFLSLRSSGKSQARNFIEHTNLEAGDFPPVLDIEKYVSAQVNTTDNEFTSIIPIAKEWLAEIENYYGVKPLIYTNLNTYYKFLQSDDTFSKYYYWIAAPGKTPPAIDNCIIWQFHHHGQVAGINDNYTDINKYLGSYSELKEFVKQEGIK